MPPAITEEEDQVVVDVENKRKKEVEVLKNRIKELEILTEA